MGKLSRTVALAGKGRVIAPKKARKVGPVSTLDMGQFGSLKSVPVEDRKSHVNVLDKVSSFDQLRIDPFLRQKIRRNLLKSPDMPPTPVQKVAIKALARPTVGLDRREWLIAAETGSGKTLSYLAPMITKLIDQHQDMQSEPEAAEDAPQEEKSQVCIGGIVLVPTTDLAKQVMETVEKIQPPGFRTAMMAGLGSTPTQLAHKVAQGLDLVVASPDKLLKMHAFAPQLMTRAFTETRNLVVDEADSLMNQSFEPSTTKLVSMLPELEDLVFVTATIPAWFDKTLRRNYPTMTRLVTPSIHRLPRNIEFKVVEVAHRPYNNNKQLALQQALYAIYNDKSEPGIVKRVLVFVNLKREVKPLVNMLKNAGYAAVDLGENRENLDQFLEAQAKNPKSDDTGNEMQVLVATDLLARGVDFHKVRNVILYDMPKNAADLLHRAGRTGRLGTKGRVILLVNKSEQKSWVRGLETIVKRGVALA